jgi:hypothetical protein
MSDFERRLHDALGHGAEDAPDAHGLADGARRRMRARRRRAAMVGAAAAVVAVIVPVAVVGSNDDRSGSSETDRPPSALGDQNVTCGSGSWPASAMEGGVSGLVDEAEVRAAFARLLEEAPIDAPEAIRQEGADKAPYIALAETNDGYTLGTGTWSIEGPGKDADIVGLERQGDGTLRASGWGDCELRVVLPPGRSPVVVNGPRGGVDPTTTEPVVMVNELDCTSGRDPVPFLGEPTVVEDDERVLVTMTSETMRGGADCQGNPSVPVTLHLDRPIGGRELLDGGTWPPTPLTVAPDLSAGWRTESYGGLTVDVPDSWKRGGLSVWCLNPSVDGWVEDPKTVVRGIHCGSPLNWYGVRFVDGLKAPPGPGEPTRRSGGQDYPDGAWVGYLIPEEANGHVIVVAPTQAVADLILSSVRKD